MLDTDQVVPAASATMHSQSPIDRLPLELLVQILIHVIGTRPSTGVCLWNPKQSQWCGPRRLPTDRYTASLLVNRAFYHAGLEAYYGNAVFKFLNANHLRAVASGLGLDRRRCIKAIVINLEFEINLKATTEEGKLMEPLCVPYKADDLAADPFVCLPSLRTVKIMLGVPRPTLAGEEMVMDEIGRTVRRAWSGAAQAIEFEWFWRGYTLKPGD